MGRAVEASKNQDHHIMPRQLKNNEVIRAARDESFKFEGAENRMPVEKFSKTSGEGRHSNHPNYNQEVMDRISKFTKDNPEFTSSDALKFTRNLVKDLKQTIENNPSTKVNDLFKSVVPAGLQDNTRTELNIMPAIKPKIDTALML
ncbi:AHH domain-containing protein [Sphingobacterium alkalisoli]|uniref:AHH domain-containing protein n=1 Tax=Sphingobacterium alkalisoli TaxID=1874115 RepID=UPI0021D07E03|nr:AHH domain-containing protein [Sphingobacterium alkalisoli]